MKNFIKVLVAIVLILAFAGFYAESKRLSLPNWVNKKELEKLQRYHGTIALKITDDDVSIWRKHKWIVVLENDAE